MWRTWSRSGLAWALLGLAFAGTLIAPSTREVLALSLRLLSHLGTKTHVQGQPPGCLLYITPTVEFTPAYKLRLRKNSARSPEAYVLASSTGDPLHLEPPPASAWRQHPLRTVAALRLGWLSCSANPASDAEGATTTNAPVYAYGDTARDVVLQTQQTDSENGALWLAQAAVEFGSAKPQAALTALQVAAHKTNWSAAVNLSFNTTRQVFTGAGLSSLDASVEAAVQQPGFVPLYLQQTLLRRLTALMSDAVRKNDDHEFAQLFALLAELGRPDWQDHDARLNNRFRRGPDLISLTEAMAHRLGRALPTQATNADFSLNSGIKEARREIFHDYIALYANPAMVRLFFEQQSAAEHSSARAKQHNQLETRRQIILGGCASLMGTLTVFLVSVVLLSVVFHSPFAWLRARKIPPGHLPKARHFWILSVLVVLFGWALLTNSLVTLGVHNEVGLRLDPPETLSPKAQAALESLLLSVASFAASVCLWTARNRPVRWRPVGFILLAALLCSAIATAYFRAQVLITIIPHSL